MNLKIICQFHAHSVHQNSVEICCAEMYRGRLLTLITGSSSRLLCIRFSADLTMYWFPMYHFRCMKFKPLVIWIWNQNIAISTIVGTSSHIIEYTNSIEFWMGCHIAAERSSLGPCFFFFLYLRTIHKYQKTGQGP